MGIVATLAGMFNGRTPEIIEGKLKEIETEISTREEVLSGARTAIREQGAMARIKGDRSPDRSKLREAEDALEELRDAREGLMEALSQAREKQRREQKAEALRAVQQALAADADVYATAQALVAVGSRVLARMGAAYPTGDRHPATIAYVNPQGAVFPSRAREALALYQALGGELSDLTPEEQAAFPFGAKALPFAAVEKAVAKLFPGGIDNIGKGTLKAQQDVEAESARSKQASEAKRLQFNAAIAKAAREYPATHTVQAVAESDEDYRTAHALLAACHDRGIECVALANLCRSATKYADGLPKISGRRQWSPNVNLVVRAIGWTGPIP